jgi:hypothetical protein
MLMRTLLMVMTFALTAGAQAHELEHVMKSLLEKQKALAAQAAVPAQNNSSADLVRDMRTLQIEALNYETHKGMQLPDPLERRKFQIAYQQAMAGAISTLAELELAFLGNDAAAIAAGMARMKADKEEGHKRFKQ